MRSLGTIVVSLLLSGCAVGPSFRRPQPPSATNYTLQPLPEAVSAGDASTVDAQSFKRGAAVSGHWWTAFGSPTLDALEDEALRHNPDLESANAALRAARQIYLSQQGNLFPSVSASSQAQRQNTAGVLQSALNDNSREYNLYSVGGTAAYTLDVFGGVRRSVEGARAQAEQQRFQTEAAYLTVTSNVANTVITLAGVERQLAVLEQVLAADRQLLGIIQQQLRLGAASGADVAAAQLALAQAEAAMPALAKQQAQSRDLLAVLVGRYPADHFEIPDFATLHAPAELPVSVPSDLVNQRPDIRAVEAGIHYASAQVGVAIAARLPNFVLTASGGGTSTALRTIFSNGNAFWSIAGNLLQPIFDGGILRHRQHAAEATLDQAKAQYRSTVLTAMQNVADVLQAITADANGASSAARADAAASRALQIAQAQARLGQISGASTLTLQTVSLQAEENLAQAKTQRLSDSVALYQALGGGWWNRNSADVSSDTSR